MSSKHCSVGLDWELGWVWLSYRSLQCWQCMPSDAKSTLSQTMLILRTESCVERLSLQFVCYQSQPWVEGEADQRFISCGALLALLAHLNHLNRPNDVICLDHIEPHQTSERVRNTWENVFLQHFMRLNFLWRGVGWVRAPPFECTFLFALPLVLSFLSYIHYTL